MPVIGGKKVREAIRLAKQRDQVASLSVGWHRDDKYPDGTPVATVAFFNEYGTSTIPERPFMRRVNNDPKVHRMITDMRVAGYDPETFHFSRSSMEGLGKKMVETYRRSIFPEGKWAPNAPLVRQRKLDRHGKSNPLMDTERMRDSITYEVIEAGENTSIIR